MNAKVAMMSKEDTVKAKRRKHASGEGLKDDHKPGVDRVFFHRDWLSQYEVFGQVVWTGKTLLREDQDQFVSIPHYTWEGYEKKVMNEAKLTSKGE